MLWTNPSTETSATSQFAAQTVTLSDDLSNYDIVRFYWKPNYASSIETHIDVDVEEFKAMPTSGNYKNFLALTSRYTSFSNGRSVYYVSETSIKFTNSVEFGDNVTNNYNVIPTKISGLK